MQVIVIEKETKPMEMLNIICDYLGKNDEFDIWSLIHREFITTRRNIFNVIKYRLNKKYKKYSSYKLAQEIVSIQEFSEKYYLIVKGEWNDFTRKNETTNT